MILGYVCPPNAQATAEENACYGHYRRRCTGTAFFNAMPVDVQPSAPLRAIKAGAKVVVLCEPQLCELSGVAMACGQKLIRVTVQTRQA